MTRDLDPPYETGSMLLLARMAKQIFRRSREAELGVDLRHLLTLSFLADHEGTPQQELVEALCMDAKNVVLLLNDLEDQGLVDRRRDPRDRRRHRVALTAKGHGVLRRACEAQAEIEDEVLRGLSAEERATLHGLLQRAVLAAEPAVEDVPDAVAVPVS